MVIRLEPRAGRITITSVVYFALSNMWPTEPLSPSLHSLCLFLIPRDALSCVLESDGHAEMQSFKWFTIVSGKKQNETKQNKNLVYEAMVMELIYFQFGINQTLPIYQKFYHGRFGFPLSKISNLSVYFTLPVLYF